MNVLFPPRQLASFASLLFTPKFALLIAILYFSYVAAMSFSMIQPQQRSASQNPVSAEPAQASIAKPDYLQMVEWHLLGQLASESSDSSQPIADSQLQLKLLGTFVLARSPASRAAIVQMEDGSQKRYRVGESLPGEALLEAIEPQRVVVNQNGRRELLRMTKAEATASPSVVQ